MTSRVWAEIDLSAIRQNIDAIRALVGPRVDLMPVVKADAYGHGMREVARAALKAGAEWLGVASVAEGVTLRPLLPDANICVFAPFDPADAEEIACHRLTPFLSNLDGARALSRAAQRLRTSVHVHLEADTGMGRSGVLPDQVAQVAEQVARMPCIHLTGLATHFPSAEDDPAFTARQLETLNQARKKVEAAGAPLRYVHCASSAAILRYPESRLNLVRPGLLLYGILPAVPPETPIPDLRPALTLKTRVVLIRSLPAGHPISYQRTHTLARASRIATLPVGYGDGYPRALGNAGHALLCGRRAPIVGRVCMDVTLADVTDIPEAAVGSEVVLIGAQGQAQIRVEEIARLIGTTEHDVTTRLTPRVPRIYGGSER